MKLFQSLRLATRPGVKPTPTPPTAAEALAPAQSLPRPRTRHAAGGPGEALSVRTTTTKLHQVVTGTGEVVHTYPEQVRVRTVFVAGLSRERVAADVAERAARAARPVPTPKPKPEIRPAVVRQRVVRITEQFDAESGELLGSSAQQLDESRRSGTVQVTPPESGS